MKNNFYRIILSLFVFGFFVLMDVFSQIVPYSGPGLVFPNNPPSSQEVNGGYFNSYFNNMFNATCPNGEVLIGFSSGATSTAPFKHDERGKPICVKFSASDGLASGFTGSMIGSGNVFPIYNNDGTGLNNSILSQTRVDNQNGVKVDGTLTVNQNDDNSAFLAHFGRKNSTNQFQGLSIFSYVPGRNRNSNLVNNEFLSGASMLYSGLASKNFHITSADENSEIRFVVGDFEDPSKVKLKLTKNGLIYPQGAGSGKILTSDVNGIATWKNPSDVFNVGNINKFCSDKGSRNACLGLGALSGATSAYDNVAVGYNAFNKNLTNGNGVAIGAYALSNNIAHSNTAVGAFAMRNHTTGMLNTAVGMGAFDYRSDFAEGNTSIGGRSSQYLKGHNNVVVGVDSGYTSSGSHNVIIGYKSGNRIVGDNNIIIGKNLLDNYHYVMTLTGSNRLNIGGWIVGDNGNIGIGTSPISHSGTIPRLSVGGRIKIADGSQGSGKILVSDANGLARWETASLGGNPNDCSATNKSVNGHNYPIIGLTNGNSFLSNYIETITGGSRQWSQRFKCEKGYIITEGSEVNSLVCNNGYISNGSACIQPSNDSKLGCSAITMNVGGREYSVPAIAHNFSAYVYSSSNIDNGHINYKQLFACNNGTITTSGTEEATSTTCSAGHAWNGSSCVLSNNNDVVRAYSGTTCNTANIQVVNITPGIDKIPENLNADTMYKLEGGVYDIAKKVNFNNCSAIVGAGTGATTIQYIGLSFGAEDLMNITKSNAVIDSVKLIGTKEGAGKVANVIRIKGTSSRDGKLKNIVIRNADIQQATNAGINAEYIEYSNFDTLLISNISSSSSSSYGIYLSSSNNNNFTNITITNISSSFPNSSSYGIYLSGSNNNNFTNITITNISSSFPNSSSSSYGIYLSGSNNNLTNITINNISSLLFYYSPSSYGIYLSGSNNNLTNITINNISSSSSYGIALLGSNNNNNNLTNITISNISSSSSYSVSSYGINLSTSNNNLTNITISNISSSSSSSSYGVRISNSNNNLTNIIVNNIYSNSSFGIDLAGSNNNNNNLTNIIVNNIYHIGIHIYNSNNALNNISIFKSNKGLEVKGNNNLIRSLISYKNKENGINITGSNNTFSNVYSYANGGAGIVGNGNSNFYYDKLHVFGNGGTNNVGPLNRGLASHWLSGFNDGVLDTSGIFSPAWAISPTNVSGFNVNTVGYQDGLTWPENITWSFGASIPRQMSPIIPSNCNISTTSTTKCRPEFGGTDTYNSLKKIGEW